ncbi:VWA domain containing CoxE-like protein [Pseudovibrio axinellae]|uniref:VWA domain containing CoxE-like protein n=1 Tax=Pseudovibrio axinellae TaxID=989403 RepID=A0A165T4A0_9HYPH|nr:VWA domain-containing protein [Pseudovibrio axinellae]KZL05407.1 VWA domain containing CoxE-like protein [Pseudovibrio axinellae]SEQ00584.1 Uncharacterized conserved protein, contains von Willebrand factor type A (vWA) domain [Pseudovibrio axinellae]
MTEHSTPQSPPSVSTAERIIQFSRLLRDNAFHVTIADTEQALRIFANDPATLKKHNFFQILQILFCKKHADLEQFRYIFDAFWQGKAKHTKTIYKEYSLAAQAVVNRNQSSQEVAGPQSGMASYFDWRKAQDSADTASDEGEDSSLKMCGASDVPNAAKTDFGTIQDPEQAEALLQLAAKLGKQLHYLHSRRNKASLRGRRIDLRRTMRKSLATQGLPTNIARRQRKKPPLQLLLFVDVSGSMEAYSIFFAHFMMALVHENRHAEAFFFNTRLLHISPSIRQMKTDEMVDKFSLLGQDWSGGTRIGDVLSSFNNGHRATAKRRQTLCLLMSDGYDAGDQDQLAGQLKVLKRSCRKLIWLNPLLGRAAFVPTAAGARLLQQHADMALPVHNLKSLQDVEKVLIHEP